MAIPLQTELVFPNSWSLQYEAALGEQPKAAI
jgi:hypothetical protein